MWGKTDGRTDMEKRETGRQRVTEKRLDTFLQIVVMNMPKVPANVGNRNVVFHCVATDVTDSGTKGVGN